MEARAKVILVTGATGRQGGAVARHLLKDGWKVRALTRDTTKLAAQTLTKAGVDVLPGNLDDRASLDRALEGAYGLYGVTQFWEHGYDGEVRHGKALADAAQAAAVKHLVYSSMGGADRKTGVPHAESKWEVEQYIRSKGLPATILRPVFFMENFVYFNRPKVVDGVLTMTMALPPNRTLQLVALDDIGAFATMAFTRPEQFTGKAIELAGDEPTMTRTVELFGRAAGLPGRFIEQPIEQVRAYMPEAAVMFDWLNRDGYHADIPALRAIYPGLKNLEMWLRETQWQPS